MDAGGRVGVDSCLAATLDAATLSRLLACITFLWSGGSFRKFFDLEGDYEFVTARGDVVVGGNSEGNWIGGMRVRTGAWQYQVRRLVFLCNVVS